MPSVDPVVMNVNPQGAPRQDAITHLGETPEVAAAVRALVPVTLMVDEATLAGEGDFSARVMTYGQRDAMGWLWSDGCLDASLNARLPVLTWAHDWSDPIGRATSWRRDGADVILPWALDDVPRATQARTQLRSGTITDISVGLTAIELEITEREDGGLDITVIEGTVAECALTLRGAVPGAQVLPETITFSAETWRGIARRAPSAPPAAPVALPPADEAPEWAEGVERMQAAIARAARPTTPRRYRR